MDTSAGRILKFLIEKHRLTENQIDIDTPLFSSGLLDSFALVELVTFLESGGSIRFKAKDVTLENLDTVARIANFLKQQ